MVRKKTLIIIVAAVAVALVTVVDIATGDELVIMVAVAITQFIVTVKEVSLNVLYDTRIVDNGSREQLPTIGKRI